MTITVTSPCASMLVESSLFNITNTSNSISVKINGGTEIILTPADTAVNYTITPLLLEVDSFAQGVYDITLTSTLIDTTVAKDQRCVALLCDLLCENSTLALYENTDNIVKVLALEGIKAATDCETCGCDVMLALYNTLIDDTTTTIGCGCA